MAIINVAALEANPGKLSVKPASLPTGYKRHEHLGDAPFRCARATPPGPGEGETHRARRKTQVGAVRNRTAYGTVIGKAFALLLSLDSTITFW